LGGTVVLDDALYVIVQTLIVFEMLGTIDVFLHVTRVLPFLTHPVLLLAEVLNVRLDFLAVQDFL
jgi:hypothetical protein